jgi:hypothetical protein
MPIRPLRPSDRSPYSSIPHITDDPTYAEAAALANSFAAAEKRVDDEILKLELELWLRSKSREFPSKAAQMRISLQRVADRLGAPPPAPPTAGESRSAEVSAGLAVLRGELPDTSAPDPRAALQARRLVLHNAWRAQTEILEEIAADLSSQVAIRFQAKHWELHLALYRAAQEMARAACQEREFRALIVQQGYTWHPNIMPAPALPETLTIGDERYSGSRISEWRGFLERMGML